MVACSDLIPALNNVGIHGCPQAPAPVALAEEHLQMIPKSVTRAHSHYYLMFDLSGINRLERQIYSGGAAGFPIERQQCMMTLRLNARGPESFFSPLHLPARKLDWLDRNNSIVAE